MLSLTTARLFIRPFIFDDQPAFDAAVAEIADATHRLLDSLVVRGQASSTAIIGAPSPAPRY